MAKHMAMKTLVLRRAVKPNMNNVIKWISIAALTFACAIAHGEPQATGQSFVVKEMNSDNGILALVLDDTAKEILHSIVHDEKLDKSTDKQERIALYITVAKFRARQGNCQRRLCHRDVLVD
jgi:hypothetical protein